jgi:GNAT superfamily N-acetyltransferase
VIAIRPAAAHDERFVIASWLSSWRDANAAGLIQDEDWFPVMWPQIKKALARPDVQTLVAYETDEADHVADLYGFIAADVVTATPLLYYVYTKQAYRKMGVAKRLFAAIGLNASRRFEFVCKAPVPAELLTKAPLARWNPAAGRRPKNDNRSTR